MDISQRIIHVLDSDGGDISLAPRILLICWPLYGVSALVLILRLLAKLKAHLPFALEDLLIGFAMLFGICHISLNTWGITFGLGRHYWYLTDFQRQQAMRAEFISQPFGIISSTFGRISFAVYLLPLVAHCRHRRWFLYLLILQNAVVNMFTIILILSQCSNIQFNWDREAHAGECRNSSIQRDMGLFQGASSSFTDLSLTIIPVTMISSLHIEKCVKIGLSFLLGVSSFALVASIIRTCLTVDGNGDETYRSTDFVTWCAVENCTVIITSSIPLLRPLFRRTTKPYQEVKQGFGFGCPAVIPLNTIDYRTSSEMRQEFDPKQCPKVDYRMSTEIFDTPEQMKTIEGGENNQKGTVRIEAQSLV
ncbi:hypothetical protein ACMFMF_006013 [Clarireedia jacksonii]